MNKVRYLKANKVTKKFEESYSDRDAEYVIIPIDDYRQLNRNSDAKDYQIKELQKAKTQEVAAAQETYVGLLRIVKERANADRDVRPKKERCGYLVRETGLTNSSTRFRSTIQTPFPVKMTREEVSAAVGQDLPDLVKRLGLSISPAVSYIRDFRGKYWLMRFEHSGDLTYDDDLMDWNG